MKILRLFSAIQAHILCSHKLHEQIVIAVEMSRSSCATCAHPHVHVIGSFRATKFGPHIHIFLQFWDLAEQRMLGQIGHGGRLIVCFVWCLATSRHGFLKIPLVLLAARDKKRSNKGTKRHELFSHPLFHRDGPKLCGYYAVSVMLNQKLQVPPLVHGFPITRKVSQHHRPFLGYETCTKIFNRNVRCIQLGNGRVNRRG